MPRSTETINPLDFIYPDRESAASVLDNFPADEILQTNMKALQRVDAKLAAVIETTQIPENYKLSITADGYFCFKIYDQDNFSCWPAQRSTPAIAARCDTKRQNLELANAAINGFGDGYTIKEILASLLPFQAIFVLEKYPVLIKASLSIHNFSEYIEKGQLVIIYGENPYDSLKEFLIDNSGFQLIEKSLYLYEFTEQQNKIFTGEVTSAVEKAYETIILDLESTGKKLSSLQSRKIDMENLDNFTIINIPDFLNPKASILSRDILAGFKDNGLNTHLNFFDSPRYASTISQAEKYIEQKPDAVVMINKFRSTSSYKFPDTMPVISIMDGISQNTVDNLDTSAIKPNDIIICDKRLTGEFPENNVLERQNFVNTDIYYPSDIKDMHNNSLQISKHDVVMITERTPISPNAYNVKLNSQIELITACCTAIVKDPAGYNKSLNKMYFENGKKKAGVKISDDKLNESLLAIFSEIAKAVVIDCYGLEIIKAGFDLAVYNYEQYLPNGFCPVTSKDNPLPHWEDSPLLYHIRGKVCDSLELNIINNSGKIFVCTYNDGRVDQLMLNIIASGGFILTRSHPRDNKQDGLKGIFEPGKEIITYTNTGDLCRKIEFYLNNEDKRLAIADKARQKLIEKRTAKKFCYEILEKLAKS